MTEPTNPTDLHGERYERQGVLGSGGQGVVYRAFDRWNQREVAIKVLSSKAAREPQTAERLSREQQALSALKGTAAVEVLDVYRGSDGELCLVMELLTGRSLDAHLVAIEEKNERLSLERIAEIFDPIVETLEVAHKAGIVHRDLKPANVFLLDDGGVRLLDFGMARLKRSAPLTAQGTVMGTPSYMAPEAWKGQSALVDHRADVYSLGVLLFRLLAGDLPFSGLTLYEKMLGSTKKARPSLVAKRPDLPRDADEWVALALAIDPDERFANVRALWNAFLTTFDIEPPRRKRSSLFSKAADKMKELVGISETSQSGETVPSAREPSFITAALQRSAMHVEEPPPPDEPPVSASSEATMLFDKQTIEIKPPSTTVERFEPIEKTLELSGKDFFVEDTLPDPAVFDDTLPDGTRLEVTLPSGTLAPEPVAQSKPAASKPASSKPGSSKPGSSKPGKKKSGDSKQRRKKRGQRSRKT